ncbi:hypothetical protein UFOVP125_57 [uncultured Caudovirales phage]|uniref:Uncharacterized protein n=1 Tax=uncultured Caudovirales phage TaxID=2100421 RepID=A0A6J5LFJ7_9CAUD|nr:hypothetical protein UFOVP125_57 [uncultured Caudovirales phage]
MATKTKDDEELHVQEGLDGTATVELPEELLAEGGEVELKKEEPRAEDNDPSDEDHPDDTDAVRAARRARRRSKKDLIRKTNEEKDVRLQMLQRQNEELMQRLSRVEQRTQQHDVNRIDKALEDQQVQLEYYRMKMAEATGSGDGTAAVEAQEKLFETKNAIQQLQALKQQADRPAAPQQKAINPNVQKHAAKWIERNDWYKPDLSDTDSRIAKQLDEEMTKEGWNAGTSEYWDELDDRLQKYLPHRYNEPSQRRDTNRSPRNTVGSSGREASAAYGGTNRTFTLSAEQVRAMKDAGMWDNPEKRAKMIKRYAADARTNNRGN